MTDRTSKTVTLDRALFEEAIGFVDRHSESWYRSGQDLLARLRAAQQVETTAERELFSQVGQLIAGWKQGCTPAEWSDFDEQVLRSWQAWRVAQMPPCPRDDLPSACGERFGPGGHHECRLQPNHDDACKCSCGAIRS